jgi:LEA14-like dessication related protein
LIAIAALLAACAALQRTEPLQVTVAGVEPMQGEGQGLEMRMMVKLRVQNPNDSQIDYNGVYVQMNVQDKTFATGVSDQAGSVPRFGEAVISVPVTISAMRMARQALGFLKNPTSNSKIKYELSGKLSGSSFNSVKFNTSGELELPTTLPKGDAT